MHHRTLTEELEELERTDPAVADAARRLDAARDRILMRAAVPMTRFRKSTAEHPVEVLR